MTQNYRTFKMGTSYEGMHYGIAIYFNAFLF